MLVGIEPALVSGELAVMKSASALGVFDSPCLLAHCFNRLLFEPNCGIEVTYFRVRGH
jgi:hypothetical protein